MGCGVQDVRVRARRREEVRKRSPTFSNPGATPSQDSAGWIGYYLLTIEPDPKQLLFPHVQLAWIGIPIRTTAISTRSFNFVTTQPLKLPTPQNMVHPALDHVTCVARSLDCTPLEPLAHEVVDVKLPDIGIYILMPQSRNFNSWANMVTNAFLQRL